MRVVLVTRGFPPDIGITPFPLTVELACGLRDLGHDVLVLTFTPGESREEVVDGIRVWRRKLDIANYPQLQSSERYFPQYIAEALDLYTASKAVIREFRPDVIETPEFYGVGLLWALERRYPFVVRCCGPLTHVIRSGIKGYFSPMDVETINALELAPVGAADGLISLCADLADRMSSWTGIPATEFSVIPVPLKPAETVFEHVPAGEGEPFPRLLYWGRVQRQKGCDILVESLPAIAEKYPNFRLSVGGKDTFEAGQLQSYSTQMKGRLQEMGLADNVEFRGFMSVEEIRREVAQTDLCLFPSRYETACYAALEAITYGGCVVAAKVGGLADHVAHGVSGWLVEPENPSALAQAVIDLSANDQLRRRLRASGPADVARRCDPLKVALHSVAVYERAIGRFAERADEPNRAFALILEGLVIGVRSGRETPPCEQAVVDTAEPASGSDSRAAMSQSALHELLCAKYSEGARAGFEQGLAEGLKVANELLPTPSFVRRIARKMRRVILRTGAN